eukprot:8851717-Alexandrium_andersonii.AAC.1
MARLRGIEWGARSYLESRQPASMSCQVLCGWGGGDASEAADRVISPAPKVSSPTVQAARHPVPSEVGAPFD